MHSFTLTINELFLNQRQSLIHTLYRMVGCLQTAEDLAQEAYLKMLQVSKVQEITHPNPFLYQIARNLALDHLRKQKVRQTDYRIHQDSEDSDEYLVSLPVITLTPEQEVIEQEEVENLLKSLNLLSERRRQILVLHKFHHWKYERIAQHFGISRSAVEKHVQLALKHLLESRSN